MNESCHTYEWVTAYTWVNRVTDEGVMSRVWKGCGCVIARACAKEQLVCVHMCIYMSVCIYVCIYVCVCACVHVRVYVYTYVQKCNSFISVSSRRLDERVVLHV